MKEIFVFGAGFTRAFCPDAPLLEDDYGTYELIEKYSNFPYAQQILELAHKKGRRKVDIEQLLTRLYSGMPYDSQIGTNAQIQMLRADVLKCLLNKLTQIQDIMYEELQLFAKHCIENKITCITFNYDDVFDRALYSYCSDPACSPGEQWNYERGYGFFCKHAIISANTEDEYYNDECDMTLLKLHGSVNWFTKIGYQSPYPLEAIVYHEGWLDYFDTQHSNIDSFVLKEPFIIPPVLMKSEITEQPLIRTIWQIAYQQLMMADSVTFIGYSLPVTDIAVRFLFKESLSSRQAKHIQVINNESRIGRQKELKKQYMSIFPNITDECFDFRDAIDWAKGLGIAR